MFALLSLIWLSPYLSLILLLLINIHLLDNVSISILILTLRLYPLLINSFYKIKESRLNYINIFTIGVLLVYFSSASIFWMFISFELILLPIIIIILGWGYQFERIQASFYMLIYTLTFSFPFFVTLIYSISVTYQSRFFAYHHIMFSWIGVFIFLPFFVKLPLVLLHYWLPKAHVEAPTIGRIILAALLLKLGRYGILRYLDLFNLNWLPFFYLALAGIIFTTLVCIFQSDTKRAVAYFSIAHINFILCCLFLMFNTSKRIRLFIIVAHGFSSGLIFFCIGTFYYYVLRRSLYFRHLSLYFFPMFVGVLSLALLSNFGVPPFINVVPEIMFFGILFKKSLLIGVPLIAYCLYMAYASLFFLMSFFHGSFGQKKFYQKRYLLFTSSGLYSVIILLNWKLLLFSII